MQSTAAVDDLILWQGAGILGLVWLIVAAASLGAFPTKIDYGSSARPPACIVAQGCDSLVRSSWQLARP